MLAKSKTLKENHKKAIGCYEQSHTTDWATNSCGAFLGSIF
jgi:hypothetical protein